MVKDTHGIYPTCSRTVVNQKAVGTATNGELGCGRLKIDHLYTRESHNLRQIRYLQENTPSNLIPELSGELQLYPVNRKGFTWNSLIRLGCPHY